MNLESLKERLLETWDTILEKVRESDTYIQLRERYQNLSPSMQKIVLWSSAVFSTLFLLFIPFTLISTSSESVESFENNVRLIRDLYRVQRELASTPMVPDPPASTEMSNQVRTLLTQSGLEAEQISGPREISPERDNTNALQPQGIAEHGIEVTLMKLNLKQVVDVGTKLSQLSGALHLTALDMKANAQNDHYYDVIFRVTGFTMPGGSTTLEDTTRPSSKPLNRGKGDS